MAASSNKRDLFLTVGGTTDPLALAMKAGKSVLREFGDASINTVDEVQKAFQKLGGADIEASARAMEATYNRTFQNIRANAQQVLAAPTPQAAVQIVNSNAAMVAAEQAQAQAAALRMVADAASRAADATNGENSAARVYAVQAAAAAVGAAQYAESLRMQADVLAGVTAELRTTGAAEEDVANHVTNAHGRMGASGMILQHVVRSTTDSFAAGLPPTMIFAEQIGRLGEAAAFAAQESGNTEGMFGKFAAFMGGPWGIAVTVGVSVLGTLVGKFMETETASKAAQKAEEEFASFQGDLANFVDTANGKLREQLRLMAEIAMQERGKSVRDADASAKDFRTQAFTAARSAAGDPTPIYTAGGVTQPNVDPDIDAAIRKAGNDPAKLAAELERIAKARPELQALADSINDLAGKSLLAQQNSARLRGEQAELNTLLHGGTVATTALIDRHVAEATATTAVEKAQAALNAVKARSADIDKMDPGPARTAALKQYERDLTAATRAVQAAQAAQKTAKSDTQVGRDATLDQAEDIVRSIGGVITSATRSYEEQERLYQRYLAGKGPLAAPPGSSAHERGSALDVRKTEGMSLGALKKAFAAQGVHLTEALDEGDHYHVAWGKKGPSQQTLDRRDANTDRGRDNEIARAEQEYAQTLQELDSTADERLQAELQRLEAAKTARDREIDQELKAGKYGDPASKEAQAAADKLKHLNASTTEAKEEVAVRKSINENLDRQLAADKAMLDGQIELLQLQEQFATTAKERRRIALQILAAEEKRANEDADRKLQSSDPDVRAQGQREKDQIKADHPYKTQDALDRTNDPMEEYRKQLKAATDDMDSALKSVEVDGLKSLEDGLVGVITGTESVGDAFKKMAASIIADLVRIGIEKAILGAIGGGTGDVGGGGGGGGNFLGTVVSFIGSIFGHADGLVPGFAVGRVDNGVIRGAGSGTSDSILAMLGDSMVRVSNGESIMTEMATRKYGPLLRAMNDNTVPGFASGFIPPSSIGYPKLPDMRAIGSAGRPVLQFDLRGAVMTEHLLLQMQDIADESSGKAVADATPGIVNSSTNRTFDQLQRLHRL